MKTGRLNTNHNSPLIIQTNLIIFKETKYWLVNEKLLNDTCEKY